MSLLTYNEEELVDSLVVDSEACVCGYVLGFNVQSTTIEMRLYDYKKESVETPDQKELTRRLLEFAPRKGFQNREPSMNEFFDWIRDSLKLSAKEPVTLEHLVKFSNLKNVIVPMKTEEKEVKVEKGWVDWSDVNKVAFTDLGKCMLLKTAVEAKNRGIKPSKKAEFGSTDDLSGKMVIDSEAKIVGSALKFLIGSPPALLIQLERAVNESEALKKALIPSRFKNEKTLLDAVRKDLKLKTINDYNTRAITIWLKKNNIDIQKELDEKRKVEIEIPVSWAKIAKVRDVVLLKEPIEQSEMTAS